MSELSGCSFSFLVKASHSSIWHLHWSVFDPLRSVTSQVLISGLLGHLVLTIVALSKVSVPPAVYTVARVRSAAASHLSAIFSHKTVGDTYLPLRRFAFRPD